MVSPTFATAGSPTTVVFNTEVLTKVIVGAGVKIVIVGSSVIGVDGSFDTKLNEPHTPTPDNVAELVINPESMSACVMI